MVTCTVVALRRNGFPTRDVTAIEKVLRVATGEEVGIEKVEYRSQSLQELATTFGDGPTMILQGLAMPLWRWKHVIDAVEIAVFVIDAGSYRAVYYHANARASTHEI